MLINFIKIWGARIIVTDVQRKGLVVLASDLIEPEPPHNQFQFTEIIDIS